MPNCEEACLKPAAGSTMIMDNERPVRISNFEICEMTAVLGGYRLCCSDCGNWVVSSRFGVIHCSAPMILSAQASQFDRRYT
jgi:hypothetical protein